MSRWVCARERGAGGGGGEVHGGKGGCGGEVGLGGVGGRLGPGRSVDGSTLHAVQ